ncbi:MAG: sulfotransferase family 2 domain-containing protein [Cyanobacterium sp.]
MIINHRYQFIFIKTYKTASTSIEQYLSKFCSPEDTITLDKPLVGETRNVQGYFNPLPEMIKYCPIILPWKSQYLKQSSNPLKNSLLKRKFYGHIPAYQARERISSKIWNNYYKFCFERNPWDKVISSYYYICKGQEKNEFSLSDYIAKGNIFNKHKSYPWNYPLYTNPLNPDEIIVDYIGKYEYLNQELAFIFGKLGIPFDGNLNTKANTNLRPETKKAESVYSEEQKQIVERLFAQEIKIHNYQFPE